MSTHTRNYPKSTHLLNSDDSFSSSIMYVVHMFYTGIQKHIDQILRGQGLISFSQFIVLHNFLTCSQSQITQAKLAEYLMLREATVSRHIRTLVAKKLLSKKQDTDNKKSYNISLTHQGTLSVLTAKDIIMKELDILFSHINKKEKTILLENLKATIILLQQKK